MTTPHLSPTSETAMAAAREIAAQYLHKDAAEKAVIYAAIIARHFQPLLAKVEGERDACHVQFKRIMDAVGFPPKSGGYSGGEVARKVLAQFKALEMDFAGMKHRFCEHHATPGAVESGCPECKLPALRAALAEARIGPMAMKLAESQMEAHKAGIELTQLRADLAAKEAALEDFAKQKTTSELVRDDVECPDFEGAYDHMIYVARSALASRADKGGTL